jgi:hypothetical protein
MAEITYLPEVECVVSVADGVLDTEVVGVPDETGNRQFLRVGKGFVTRENGKTYLPVGVVELDYRKRRALVELPYEAASGARRLWVPFTNFRQQRETA